MAFRLWAVLISHALDSSSLLPLAWIIENLLHFHCNAVSLIHFRHADGKPNLLAAISPYMDFAHGTNLCTVQRSLRSAALS